MQVLTITNGDNANGNYDLELMPAYRGHPEAVVQIEITGSATVTLQGRIDEDFTFQQIIAATTADVLQPISFIPQLRAVISGYTTGNVVVKVLIPESARA